MTSIHTFFRRPLAVLLALLLALFAQGVAAEPLEVPKPPQLQAKAYLLIDFYSDQVLVEKDAGERIEPASLTKMMSAYTVAYALKEGIIGLQDEVRISEKAWRTGGSKMFIEVGKKVTVENLLKGVIVQSGNDATIALAEHVAGSEESFVSLMNQHAERLGLYGTHFENSTGLPHENHFSTARDLAMLAKAIIRDFPKHYKWYSMREFTWNNIRQPNRNKLLWEDDGVDGVKTGHTESAGYCLVASARKNDMRLLSVVLGTKTNSARARESRKLLNYGFRFFETKRLYTAGQALKEVPVWKGQQEKLRIGIDQDLYVTIPKGQEENLEVRYELIKQIVAPTRTGQQLGTVTITLGDEEFAQRQAIALDDVESGGLINNLVDEVKLFFN